MSDFPFNKHINSVCDLELILTQIREYRGLSKYNEVFRGQGRDCWKLIPKIARDIKDPQKIKYIELNITKEFLQLLNKKGYYNAISTGQNNRNFETEWLLIQQAQHFELPTRFMDWTGNWDTALCFAVASESDDTCDGQVWIYFVPQEKWINDNGESNYLNENPFEYEQTIFLNSAYTYSENAQIQIAQRRKSTQNGKFCIQPYSKVIMPMEEQDEHKPYLTKIIIPAKFKKPIREELKAKGITKDALFVSETINPEDKEKYEKLIEEINKIVKCLSLKFGV
jgi:hypothetical protein